MRRRRPMMRRNCEEYYFSDRLFKHVLQDWGSDDDWGKWSLAAKAWRVPFDLDPHVCVK